MMSPDEQLAYLNQFPYPFDDAIRPYLGADGTLTASALTTLQLNIGKRCNQSCRHCHVGASPTCAEMMSPATIDACLQAIANLPDLETVDITGGAPEMHPQFRYLVQQCRALGKHVIDRCNLTILDVPEYADLADFLAEQQVEIVASLPYYRKSYTDRQRGAGVFDVSVRVLQRLNRLGYGTALPLNLIYNPTGLYLASSQQQLEHEFKIHLKQRYDIDFHHLYCLNNMPLDGFLQTVLQKNKFPTYMDLLHQALNPCTLPGLMCRQQLSVGYDGALYDCDFNQMLGFTISPGAHIGRLDSDTVTRRAIITANHCFGCTAGTGSSCGGELISE